MDDGYTIGPRGVGVAGYALLDVPVQEGVLLANPIATTRLTSELSDICADVAIPKKIFQGTELDYVDFLMGDFID